MRFLRGRNGRTRAATWCRCFTHASVVETCRMAASSQPGVDFQTPRVGASEDIFADPTEETSRLGWLGPRSIA